jgi:ankyrin repeat protein
MAEYQAIELLIEEIKKEDPDLELIKDILEYSVVDVNGKYSGGKTALMFAASSGKAKSVELLLKHPKINVNVQTKIGRTAWDMASGYIRQKFPQLNPNFQ